MNKLLKTQSLVAYAISDETRRRVLSRLMKSPASLTDLAQEFKISKPLMHYHLKILESSGLIKIVSTRKCGRGPKRKFYGLTITGVQVVKNLIETSGGFVKGSFVVVKFITNNDPYVYQIYKRALQLVLIPIIVFACLWVLGLHSGSSPLMAFISVVSVAGVSLVLLCSFFVIVSRVDWLREKLFERSVGS